MEEVNNDENIRYRVDLDADGYRDGVEDVLRGSRRLEEGTESSNRRMRDETTRTSNEMNGFFGRLRSGFEGIETIIKASAIMWLLGKIIELGREMVGAANKAAECTMALKGLNEVAKAFGEDGGAAQDYARQLSEMSGGMVSVKQAAEGLKFLLSSKFSVTEAFQLSKGMLEIGAFNNVVGDLGQAYVDSAKGIKTGSVELTENIGLTEKLSSVMEKAGISTKNGIDVTNDAAQRMALYNSIMKQSESFTGNLQEAQKGYVGEMAEFNTELGKLIINIGYLMQPIVSMGAAIGTNIIKPISNWLASLKDVKAEAVKSVEAQQAQFNALKTTYEDLHGKIEKTESETKLYKETIAELKNLYPDYLNKLDLEKGKYEEIAIAIENTNKQLQNKYLYAKKDKEIGDVQEKIDKGKIIEYENLKEIEELKMKSSGEKSKEAKQGIELEIRGLEADNYRIEQQRRRLEAEIAEINKKYAAIASIGKNGKRIDGLGEVNAGTDNTLTARKIKAEITSTPEEESKEAKKEAEEAKKRAEKAAADAAKSLADINASREALKTEALEKKAKAKDSYDRSDINYEIDKEKKLLEYKEKQIKELAEITDEKKRADTENRQKIDYEAYKKTVTADYLRKLEINEEKRKDYLEKVKQIDENEKSRLEAMNNDEQYKQEMPYELTGKDTGALDRLKKKAELAKEEAKIEKEIKEVVSRDEYRVKPEDDKNYKLVKSKEAEIYETNKKIAEALAVNDVKTADSLNKTVKTLKKELDILKNDTDVSEINNQEQKKEIYLKRIEDYSERIKKLEKIKVEAEEKGLKTQAQSIANSIDFLREAITGYKSEIDKTGDAIAAVMAKQAEMLGVKKAEAAYNASKENEETQDKEDRKWRDDKRKALKPVSKFLGFDVSNVTMFGNDMAQKNEEERYNAEVTKIDSLEVGTKDSDGELITEESKFKKKLEATEKHIEQDKALKDKALENEKEFQESMNALKAGAQKIEDQILDRLIRGKELSWQMIQEAGKKELKEWLYAEGTKKGKQAISETIEAGIALAGGNIPGAALHAGNAATAAAFAAAAGVAANSITVDSGMAGELGKGQGTGGTGYSEVAKQADKEKPELIIHSDKAHIVRELIPEIKAAIKDGHRVVFE